MVLVVLVPGHKLSYFTYSIIELKIWLLLLLVSKKIRLISVSFNQKGLQVYFAMHPLEGTGHCFCTIILLQ